MASGCKSVTSVTPGPSGDLVSEGADRTGFDRRLSPPSPAPLERAAVVLRRRQLAELRVCPVCSRPVPEGAGVFVSHRGLIVHAAGCVDVVLRRSRGRWGWLERAARRARRRRPGRVLDFVSAKAGRG